MKIKFVLVIVAVLLMAGCSLIDNSRTFQPDISHSAHSPTNIPAASAVMKEFSMNDGRLSASLPEEWTMEDKSTEAGTIFLWTSPDEDSIIGMTHAVLAGITKTSFTTNYMGIIQKQSP